MKTKREIIEKELNKIKDFDKIVRMSAMVYLKGGESVWTEFSVRSTAKLTKKEYCFKKINSLMRNDKWDESHPVSANTDIKNIESLEIKKIK